MLTGSGEADEIFTVTDAGMRQGVSGKKSEERRGG
jgi:hypothetical protein